MYLNSIVGVLTDRTVEVERQSQLLTEARNRQKELQTLAHKSTVAEREAKLVAKKRHETPQVEIAHEPQTKIGEEWVLGRHLVYCGDTAGQESRNLLPSDAALAIATLSPTCNHNYLVSEAQVVAVLLSEGHIYEFYRHNQMPFQEAGGRGRWGRWGRQGRNYLFPIPHSQICCLPCTILKIHICFINNLLNSYVNLS